MRQLTGANPIQAYPMGSAISMSAHAMRQMIAGPHRTTGFGLTPPRQDRFRISAALASPTGAFTFRGESPMTNPESGNTQFTGIFLGKSAAGTLCQATLALRNSQASRMNFTRTTMGLPRTRFTIIGYNRLITL